MDKFRGQRPFSAEIIQGGQRPVEAEPAGIELVAAAIDRLTAEVRGLRSGMTLAAEPAPEEQTMPSLPSAEAAELALLRSELQNVANVLGETKLEIASLRARQHGSRGLGIAANELDAIVEATGAATHAILEQAERMDEIAAQWLAQAGNDHQRRLASDLSERCTEIYQACTFQDVTGQRVAKVVKTLKYVEEHIDRMISIFGVEALADLTEKAKADQAEDSLLSGPALKGQGISQDDIDKLFD